MTTPQDDKPIFESEKAPPTLWEQLVASFRPARPSRPVQPKPRPQTPREVMVALGRNLAGATGGVLLMLGILGVSMSLLLAVALVVTATQNLTMGINWVVVPVSLLIFGVVGLSGYLLLRSTGMLARRTRSKR
ncbi:MAG TPA: hypothetical protein VFK68_13145 [Propionibacteriaceae bacterium]|nr:hypothetical protein [Propionibacteriaceae bacterium]